MQEFSQGSSALACRYSKRLTNVFVATVGGNAFKGKLKKKVPIILSNKGSQLRRVAQLPKSPDGFRVRGDLEVALELRM